MLCSAPSTLSSVYFWFWLTLTGSAEPCGPLTRFCCWSLTLSLFQLYCPALMHSGSMVCLCLSCDSDSHITRPMTHLHLTPTLLLIGCRNIQYCDVTPSGNNQNRFQTCGQLQWVDKITKTSLFTNFILLHFIFWTYTFDLIFFIVDQYFSLMMTQHIFLILFTWLRGTSLFGKRLVIPRPLIGRQGGTPSANQW